MLKRKKMESFNFIGETIGYARVSTREQSMKGYSINEQKELIENYAKAQSLEIKEGDIVADSGFSASSLRRPGLQQLLRSLQAKESTIKRIIILNSSRLTRDPLNKYTLKCVFEKFNIEILCIEGKWATDNPAEEIGTDIQVYLDAHTMRRVGPDTIKGMTGSAKSGNYSIGGLVPRGYSKVENNELGKGYTLAPIENQKEYIEYIFTSLKNRKHTISSIARLYHKNRVMNLNWSERNIRVIIENPIYYGRFKSKFWDIENHTIPIITKELYEECHEALKVQTRVPKHFYIYGGLVYCTHCHQFCIKESAFKKRKDGTKVLYQYYRCTNCKKRINEKNVDKTVAGVIDHQALPKQKFDLIKELNIKKEQIEKRINIYENNFDEFLMDEKEFKTKFQDAKHKIMEINKELNIIADTSIESFKNLSRHEKKKLANEKIARIDIDFINSNHCNIILEDKAAKHCI